MDEVCECGHDKDEHLVRVQIPANVYGPCKAMADKWTRCCCAMFEGVDL